MFLHLVCAANSHLAWNHCAQTQHVNFVFDVVCSTGRSKTHYTTTMKMYDLGASTFRICRSPTCCMNNGARSANCFYCIGMFYQRSDPSGHGTYNEYPLDPCAHHSEASAAIIVCKTSTAVEPAAVTAKTVCVYLRCWGYVSAQEETYKVKYCLKAVLKKFQGRRMQVDDM